MGNRLELQTLLETALGSGNVYFQPPESVKIQYPCIIYSYNFAKTFFADDKPYRHKFKYDVTLIDKNPDSAYLNTLIAIPMTTFNTQFTKDNLNHFVYTMYY